MGHIHIGYDNPDYLTSLAIIKAMDLFLGVPSIILDSDNIRRKTYGKAGAFRPKKYGVEYRTLSNFWITDQKSVNWVFKQVQKAVDFVNNKIELSDEDQLNIQIAINTGNTEAVLKILTKFNMVHELESEMNVKFD